MTAEQKAALEIVHGELFILLADAVRVLEAENLPYSLICGTLLGAVRHGGFIPWDDDIDIVMPRQSYERFAAIYPEKAAEGFCLDVMDTWVPRIRKAGGRKSAFLDIFILDPLPVAMPVRSWKLFRLKTLQGMLKEHTEYQRFSLPKRLLLWTTDLLGKPFSKASKLRAYHRISQEGSPQSPSVHMANGAFHLLSMPWNPADFTLENLTHVPFEGLPVRVSKNAESHLIALYGANYMTPPPENQRVPLHLDL